MYWSWWGITGSKVSKKGSWVFSAEVGHQMLDVDGPATEIKPVCLQVPSHFGHAKDLHACVHTARIFLSRFSSAKFWIVMALKLPKFHRSSSKEEPTAQKKEMLRRKLTSGPSTLRTGRLRRYVQVRQRNHPRDCRQTGKREATWISR